MTLRFGTDGVRGVANVDLTPELVVALGRASARLLASPRFVIGRDTRRSGAMLEAALVAGLAAEGVDAELLGVVPTPTVAWAAGHGEVAGAMISASHNPFPDNGIKLFAPGGHKLSDAVEEQLEGELDRLLRGTGAPPSDPEARSVPTGAAVGATAVGADAVDGYRQAVAQALEGRRLDGLRVVIDCANGSASTTAARVLRDLGAQVTAIHDQPDGVNINEGCGSTHPAALQAAVVADQADVGLAFDGDADRLLAVDHTGALVDGDQIMGICALDLAARDRLAHRTLVVTVMSNLGLRRAMQAADIDVVETAVGDRYVLEAIRAGGYNLGGEQSGHLIFADHATTGDGLLAGVQLLDVLARTGRDLATAAAAIQRLPQVLHNVRLPAGASAGPVVDALAGALAAARSTLGDDGRVLVRPSGTEPLVRIMVEAATEATATEVATELAAAATLAAR